MSSHSHADAGRRGPTIPRQGSVYGLTLTEVETHLGKPLRPMNLDDLLRTVLPAAPGSTPAAKKTVDEVWRDIQSAGDGGREPSMGEMTLEDFLARAGVAVDAAAPHGVHAYQPQYGLPRPLPLAATPGQALDAAYRGDRAGVFLSHSHSQVAGRKRGAADGVVERTVERRQKRMIKNREYAARYRARKQAYTNELENLISQLEGENVRLKKIEELETNQGREQALARLATAQMLVLAGRSSIPTGSKFPSHSSAGELCSTVFFQKKTSQGLHTATGYEDSRYMHLNILKRILNGIEEPKHLDLALLQSITENFSEKKKIGSGGCGIVYKGILQNGVVAVKRLLNIRTIKDKMFHREVLNLISVKHQNIVRLLGYCSFTEEHAILLDGRTIMADIRERLLCFEYIRNGSLEKHLTDELRGLEWRTRYRIIIGICMGLNYLHKDKEIIHMDLKPSNILLDDLMVPKITDFGLSRLQKDPQDSTRLISPGYTAPEYISRGEATRKSDIYSLGVIIIELMTGSKTDPNITKVLRRWNHRWIKSIEQSSFGYQQVEKCLELALRCKQDEPTDRPDISYIIDELKKIDTTDGQTQIHISPYCSEDILRVEPLEIYIPFEDLNVSHSIELTNDTDDHIAFVTKAKLDRCCTKPDKGIVPPRSKCSVTLAMQAQVNNVVPNKPYSEVITVLSTRVDDGALATMDTVTTGDIFTENEKGEVVDEVNVMVVFGKLQLPEE